MISVDEALDLVLAEIEPQRSQSIDLTRAAGRILAEPIAAGHDAPPFDNSAMDGFAVRCSDLADAGRESPNTLPLQGEIIAGDDGSLELQAGATLRINTGAPLPAGSEAVVPIEDVDLSESEVRFFGSVPTGQHIRRAGEDFKKGQQMLAAGHRIEPRALGLLASLGVRQVPVARRPRLALIASGDELVEPGRPLAAGQIYNSSRYSLIPMLTSFGAEVHDLGVVGDDRARTREILEEALTYDIAITTGGVSMGSHDFIRPTLHELGAREIFWKVKQRPGKPLFTARTDRTLCLCLPGNPVSVFVTALIYARAALLKMQGAAQIALPWRSVQAGADFAKRPGLTVFARADWAEAAGDDGDGGDGGSMGSNRAEAGGPHPPRIVPSGRQGSHQFSTLSSSAGLVRLPEESGPVTAGEGIDFLDFDLLF